MDNISPPSHDAACWWRQFDPSWNVAGAEMVRGNSKNLFLQHEHGVLLLLNIIIRACFILQCELGAPAALLTVATETSWKQQEVVSVLQNKWSQGFFPQVMRLLVAPSCLMFPTWLLGASRAQQLNGFWLSVSKQAQPRPVSHSRVGAGLLCLPELNGINVNKVSQQRMCMQQWGDLKAASREIKERETFLPHSLNNSISSQQKIVGAFSSLKLLLGV